MPTGMTVKANDGTRTVTHNTSYAELRLAVCTYDILVHNLSDSEFGGIAFDGFTARGVATTVPSWLASGSEVLLEPEWLAAGVLECVEVLPVMIGGWCKCTDCECVLMHSAPFQAGMVAPRQLTYDLHIAVYADGLENVRSVAGAFSGLASEVEMTDGETSGTATQLLSGWSIGSDHLSTAVRCFGLADGQQTLTLRLLLVDGQTVVEKRVDATPSVKGHDIYVEVTLDEPIPDVSVGGNGGFDVGVDDWGDPSDIDVKL